MPDRPTLSLIALCALAYLGLIQSFGGFVLDDAFITYRYAENLALHGELTWNLGEDPVEGYTSFLWVLANAAGIRLGVEPTLLSKLVSAASGLAILAILATASRGLPWVWRVLVVGVLAFSPAFALATSQGMETAATALLVLGAAIAALRFAERPSPARSLTWFAAMLLCALARSDTAPFAAGLVLGVVAILPGGRLRTAAGPLSLGAAAAIVVGGAYMLWRWNHYGYAFPNTYYIKMGTDHGLWKAKGFWYAASFYSRIAAPFAFLLVIALDRHHERSSLRRIVPIGLGTAFFGAYLLTIWPIQGVAWRFVYPVVPAVLFAVALHLREAPGSLLAFRTRVAPVVLLVLSLAWILSPGRQIRKEAAERTPHDRIQVGRQLAGLQGTILLSESGAIPYYSKWRAVDLLGLNSEQITHRGLSCEYIAALNPDVIMFRPDSPRQWLTTLRSCMTALGYVGVAAIHRQGDLYHYYFVRSSSAIYDAVVTRLRSVEGVEYGDLRAFLRGTGIGIAPTHAKRSQGT